MKNSRIFIIFIIMTMYSLTLFADDLKLWYSQPATTWTEALPLGNSRLGVMVFGGVGTEELQLNEETVWGGGPHRNDNPNALQALPQIRQRACRGREYQSILFFSFYQAAISVRANHTTAPHFMQSL